MKKDSWKELASFIEKSPTAFHAVATIQEMLVEKGYQYLGEEEAWNMVSGGKYYVTRNASSIIAFQVGDLKQNLSFHITASHSDSPAFKLKEHAILEVAKKYAKLNTEGYGGMLCAPWFDRPLSLAGRVIVKQKDTFEQRLVCFDRDLCVIPSVAIHMNRESNDGMKYNKQVDMLPLLGGEGFTEEDFKALVAKEAGVKPEHILGTELFVYNRMKASNWGAKEEFISAPRLDDLQCAYGSLMGFLKGENKKNINVFACFDNEEVGSGTKQGADSTFLADVMKRIYEAAGKSKEEYHRAVANSFMLSCDNAHAVHPNHPEKTDETNRVFMNEGIVMKSHAGQKYTSDAVSMAMFREICDRAGVPVQCFANRSDAAGGSTLGNIAMAQVSMNTVDIGLPQLSMHSPYETAGVKDTEYLIKAVKEFYKSHFEVGKSTFRI